MAVNEEKYIACQESVKYPLKNLSHIEKIKSTYLELTFEINQNKYQFENAERYREYFVDRLDYVASAISEHIKYCQKHLESWLRERYVGEDGELFVGVGAKQRLFADMIAQLKEIELRAMEYKENLLRSEGKNEILPGKEVVAINLDYSNKEGYFFTDKIGEFKAIELEMIQLKFIQANGQWHRNKEKKLLVALIYILKNLGYLKPKLPMKSERTTLLAYRRFFEGRYDLDISKEMQPSQFKINKLKIYSADYYFIPEIGTI